MSKISKKKIFFKSNIFPRSMRLSKKKKVKPNNSQRKKSDTKKLSSKKKSPKNEFKELEEHLCQNISSCSRELIEVTDINPNKIGEVTSMSYGFMNLLSGFFRKALKIMKAVLGLMIVSLPGGEFIKTISNKFYMGFKYTGKAVSDFTQKVYQWGKDKTMMGINKIKSLVLNNKKISLAIATITVVLSTIYMCKQFREGEYQEKTIEDFNIGDTVRKAFNFLTKLVSQTGILGNTLDSFINIVIALIENSTKFLLFFRNGMMKICAYTDKDSKNIRDINNLEKLIGKYPCTIKKNFVGQDKQLLIVSASNNEREWTNIICNNQIESSQINKYSYRFYQGFTNFTKDRDAQWIKIYLLQLLLQQEKEFKMIMWIDDDILMKKTDWLRGIIEHFRFKEKEKSLLITSDAGGYDINKLNTGIMIFKNNETSKKILNEIWDIGEDKGLKICPQQSCLHEQESLEFLRNKRFGFSYHRDQSRELWDAILVVPPRRRTFNLNTFFRETHYDLKRNMHLDYKNDPKVYSFREGDNTAHCTGMYPELRFEKIKELINNKSNNF